MSRTEDPRAMDHLVARIREAEQRAARAGKLEAEIKALKARISADAQEIRALRAVAARAEDNARQLDASNERAGDLLRRVARLEKRRDAAVAAEAEACARRRVAEQELSDVIGERDQAVEDLRRFRNLRWNRMGIALRKPVNRVRALLGR